MAPSPVASIGRALARHWPLIPVLALAAFLRFHRLFDSFYHGDEAEYVLVAQALAGDWRSLSYPDVEGFGPSPFVSQPPLVLYLFAAAIEASGPARGPLVVSALLGTLTAAVLYAIGCKLQGRGTGLLAGTFLAVLPAHVSLSRGAQLDAALAFFFCLAMLATLHWLEKPTPGRAMWAGTCAAFAVLAKLPGVLVLLPMAFAVAWVARNPSGNPRDPQDGAGAWRRGVDWGALMLAPVALAGLLYFGLLWHLAATQDLLAKLGWQAGRVTGTVAAPGVDRPWHWYFADPDFGLGAQLGPALALLACVGAWLALGGLRSPQRRAAAGVLLLWPACVLAAFLSSARKEWFYLMPAVPALCLLAGWAGDRARQALAAHRPGAHRLDRAVTAGLAAALVACACALPAAQASWQDRVVGANQFGRGVPQAAQWIAVHDPEAAQVGTLLGRFTLHHYNGQDTLHYFVNHTYVEERIAAGQVRYLVWDPYLDMGFEQAWLAGLVEGHGGVVVHEVPGGYGGTVKVYRLSP